MKYAKWILINAYLFPLAFVLIILSHIPALSAKKRKQYSKELYCLIDCKDEVAPWPWG